VALTRRRISEAVEPVFLREMTSAHRLADMGSTLSGPSSSNESTTLRSPGHDRAIFLISWRCGDVKVGGRPPAYCGYR